MYDIVNKKGAAEAATPKKEEPAKPAAKTLSQVSDNSQKLVDQRSETETLLRGISEEAMQRMVDQAITNASNKPAPAQGDTMRAVESYLTDSIYNRIIDQGYYRPTYRSAYYRPYYPAYRPYSYGLDYEVKRLLNYHEYLNNYDTVNHVVSHTHDPKLQEIIGVLYDLANKKDGAAATPAASANATANATAPAKKTLLQLEATGVPVFVDPSLINNDMSDADMQQRDYIIDGVNGIDLVQTEDEEDGSITMNIDG